MRHFRDWDGMDWILALCAICLVLAVCQCSLSWARLVVMFSGM